MNRAIEAVRQIPSTTAAGWGVFWHTRGSGKEPVDGDIRREGVAPPGRQLDLRGGDRPAGTGRPDRRHLCSDRRPSPGHQDKHRRRAAPTCASCWPGRSATFTLIHKFGTERGEPMPVLSERRDIIVITDGRTAASTTSSPPTCAPGAAERGLHRLHQARRRSLGRKSARARCSATTCRSTNFAQSVADGATVPLYYEARKPELQLADADTLRDDWTSCSTPPCSTTSRRKSCSASLRGSTTDHARRPAGPDRGRPGAPLRGPRLPGQTDVRGHRQDHGGAHT